MRLYAVADIHLGHPDNRALLPDFPSRPDDWLILAGDVGESERHLVMAFDALQPRFRQLVWVPGNHELWSVASHGTALRGVERYERLVDLCRERGILTPEDPYAVDSFDGIRTRIVPMFLLYDYSFRPAGVAFEDAVAWARESGVVCSDEHFLSPAPYASRAAWCEARCRQTLERLAALDDDLPTVLVNHWPLREELARLPMIPRFSLWCGTMRTRNWHKRFAARAVVYGHTHMPRERRIDDTWFHEVSLGYPKQWRGRRDPLTALRRIMISDPSTPDASPT